MTVSGDSVEAELRVGMLDMALAKLLSKQHHTIEFPTLLLPENVEPGSIVRLTCTRAAEAELEDAAQFDAVQSQILENFALNLPKKPVLRCHNVTQTSVVLEWDPLDIASADLRYLALYKDSQRLGLIPNALKRTSMKVSNLEIDMPYTFRLVLSTSAGDFESDALEVQTRKMSDLSGVVVCVGSLNHSSISEEEIEATLERLGCKPAQSAIKLDTTHFLCTTEGGSQYDRAVELSIPIVRPEWLKACEAERKLVSVRGYYLSADPQLVPPPRERTLSSPQVSAAQQRTSEERPNGEEGARPEENESSKGTGKNHHVHFEVPENKGGEPAEPTTQAPETAESQSSNGASVEQPEQEVPEQEQPEQEQPEQEQPEQKESEQEHPEQKGPQEHLEAEGGRKSSLEEPSTTESAYEPVVEADADPAGEDVEEPSVTPVSDVTDDVTQLDARPAAESTPQPEPSSSEPRDEPASESTPQPEPRDESASEVIDGSAEPISETAETVPEPVSEANGETGAEHSVEKSEPTFGTAETAPTSTSENAEPNTDTAAPSAPETIPEADEDGDKGDKVTADNTDDADQSNENASGSKEATPEPTSGPSNKNKKKNKKKSKK